MSADELRRHDNALGALRRFGRRPSDSERCDLCSRAVGPDHRHLIEPATRQLVCACDACAFLFPDGHPRYARVPRTIRLLPGFTISEAQWDSLLIPIEMAFFYHHSPSDRVVAVYPSPAGPTESQLPLDAWKEIVGSHPELTGLASDVEALVANRLGRGGRGASPDDRRPEYYILPIDYCFRLVGVIRLHWRGLSGGAEVWKEIARFFDDVRARAGGREVARA
jgi:hypothetical protein